MTEYRRAEGSLLGQQDLYLFNEGSHLRLYDVLGAHLVDRDGLKGVQFAVWAPGADYVSVIADFNGWNNASHPLTPRDSSGMTLITPCWGLAMPKCSPLPVFGS